MTLIEHLNKVPPVLCRLYARTGNRASTCQEIADRSGISKMKVARLSKSSAWDGYQLATISKFLAGCGIEFERLHTIPSALQRLANQPDPMPHIRERLKSNKGRWPKTKAMSAYYSSLLAKSAQAMVMAG